ncbi:MAG: ATP-binding protein [Cyanobacteria bacterium J06560_2]
MNNHAMSAFSLQARLNSLQPQPTAIAVDPKGFKSALESFIQFLIQREVSATLWLKLPKGEAWWEDIWQYGQQAVGCNIYTLGEQVSTPPDALAASFRPIPIEATGALKKEYLCLAIADNFMGSLLAARVPAPPDTANKRNLRLYCSTSSRTMSALSGGIKKILENSLPAATKLEAAAATGQSDIPQTGLPSAAYVSEGLTDERLIAAAAALSQWERSFPAKILGQNILPLSEAFLTWQLQFQEDLRSQLSETRLAAPDAPPATASPSISTHFLSQARQELQAPLTTIKTALTLLGAPTLKLAQRQRYLEMISTQCEQQQGLINNIVELLQIQTKPMGKPQAIKLSDLIPGIVSTYQPIAEERGIMLAYTVPDNLVEISGIEAEIKQIVIQLINNGIQITPKNGRVWVSAAAESDHFMALTIQDSGGGIAKNDLDRLFEAFYQVSHGSGSGLGLTLVHQLVERMGGSISVDSTPNQGTRFKILLPIYTGPSSSNSSKAERASQAHSVAASVNAARAVPGWADSQQETPAEKMRTPVANGVANGRF